LLLQTLPVIRYLIFNVTVILQLLVTGI
jgi:hypothetical protein